MMPALIDHFETLEDPRDPGKIQHRLIDILVIAVCAVTAEGESFSDMEDYGRAKEGWLRGFLELPHGIPSHDTFRRVFSLIEPKSFGDCFLGWVQNVFKDLKPTLVATDRRPMGGPRQIAIDGKSVRRSMDRHKELAPIHLVNAYACEAGLALTQAAVPAKSHETAALPELLAGLDIKNCLISLDAGFCQKAIANQIRERRADYLICLKGNQPALHAEVKKWFEQNCFNFDPNRPFHRPHDEYFDDSHGRCVRRRVFANTNPKLFPHLKQWPDAKTVIAVENIYSRNTKPANVKAEIRYFLTSSKLDGKSLGQAIRRHWAIENGLHWVMDVIFNEDQCRVRDRNAAQNLAGLRKIALNLARLETTPKVSMRRKRKWAAWENDFMIKLMQAGAAMTSQ